MEPVVIIEGCTHVLVSGMGAMVSIFAFVSLHIFKKLVLLWLYLHHNFQTRFSVRIWDAVHIMCFFIQLVEHMLLAFSNIL